jgi:hypothetical protein
MQQNIYKSLLHSGHIATITLTGGYRMDCP